MQKLLLFVTVSALVIVAGSVWMSEQLGQPSLEIDFQFKVTIGKDGDKRGDS